MKRLALEELLQITLYYFFIVRIEGIGSFVEEQIIGITVDGACYQDALFLSLAAGASASGEVSAVETASNGYYTEHIGVVDYQLPLFDGETEFSIFWNHMEAGGGAVAPGKEDIPFWQTLQEQLGITLSFVQPSSSTVAEQYSLMIASGDWTDLIYEKGCSTSGTAAYTGGYDMAIDDDVYLELTDLIPEYAPNYYAILMEDENLLRDVSTDTGKLYSIYMIYDEPQRVTAGPIINQDVLDTTGLDAATSTEDWLELLAALKSNGAEYPIAAGTTGDISGGYFTSAFGTTASHAFKLNLATDELVYDGTSQELRDYIEYFVQLLDAGYVSPDFISLRDDAELISSGESVLFGSMNSAIKNWSVMYDITLNAVPYAYVDGEDSLKISNYELANQRVTALQDIVVTTSCKEPEKALIFLDWFYCTEGASASTFGFHEGESYEIVDGVKQWLPIMDTRDENQIKVEWYYTIDEGIGIYVVNRKYPLFSDEVKIAKEMWVSSANVDNASFSTLPPLTLTADEADEVAQVDSDISTYVETEIARFLTGQNPLTDESWNEYVETVENIGIDELQAVYEAAYARYKIRIS